MQKAFHDFSQIVKQARRFVLTTHVNPDPDAIGSELALARYLSSQGKIVAILNHSTTPANCAFLDPENAIQQFEPLPHANMVLNADVIIVLDANQPDRIQNLKPYVLQSRATKICIDHHPDPLPFADLYIVDEAATATGEILFNLLLYLDEASITPEIATPLYTAIMTDTGSFRFPKTDPELHRVVATLIEHGADPVQIYHDVYEQGTANRLLLLGNVLSTLQMHHGGKVASLIAIQEMFNRTETTEEDTENFVTYTLAVAGVQIGVMFTELPEGIKISFRSRAAIAVNTLAQEFGGNGHVNAAGARMPQAALADVFPRVIEQSKQYLV